MLQAEKIEKSVKHDEGLERLASKEMRERTIADLLKRHGKEVHLVGEKPPESACIYWIKG